MAGSVETEAKKEKRRKRKRGRRRRYWLAMMVREVVVDPIKLASCLF